jgi:beta-lactamase regulating signal transducer with metallopeptidase domain
MSEAVIAHIQEPPRSWEPWAAEPQTAESDVTASGVLGACREPVAATEGEFDAPVLIPSDWVRRETWGRWWAGLLAVREAVGQLPPLPPWFWLSGVGALTVLWALQTMALARRTTRTRVAPPSVRRMVVKASSALGLGRIPETFMLEAPVAPMIWCLPLIGGPRLILPAALWSELDECGRRAVIYHELAHLRRRDHWVRWIEAAVGALYWWHPLVWWARRHVREEAELSCDAWVIWLMPRARRTYAEALLHARQVVDSQREPVSAVALAFTSRRSKTLARRITMVMTESVRPKLSMAGLALVLVLAVAGWLAMPTLAAAPQCDKDPAAKGEAKCAPKCKASCQKKCEKVIVLPARPGVPDAPGVPCVPGAVGIPPVPGDVRALCCPPAGDSPLPLAMSLGVGAHDGRIVYLTSGDEDDLEARLERLERLVATLAKKMGASCEEKPCAKPCEKERKKERARVYRRARPMRAPRPAPPPPPVPPAPPAKLKLEEQSVREYRLSSEGKLKALTELMAREDVPVLISPMEDGIRVHGTGTQHAIFKAFVDMIDPKEGSEGADEAAASLRDLLHGHVVYSYPGPGDPADVAGLEARKHFSDTHVLKLEEREEALEREHEALAEAIELEREAMHEALERQREALHDALEAERESVHEERESLHDQLEDEREALEEHHAELEDARRELREGWRQLERERRELERMRRHLERSRERHEVEDEETL